MFDMQSQMMFSQKECFFPEVLNLESLFRIVMIWIQPFVTNPDWIGPAG